MNENINENSKKFVAFLSKVLIDYFDNTWDIFRKFYVLKLMNFN